jgi:hypothetical protein
MPQAPTARRGALPSPGGRSARLLTPRVLLPAMAVALLVALLFSTAPTGSSFDRSPPLRTTDHGPGGAAGFFEVAQRLGWRVSRRSTAFTGALDTALVYAVLAPVRPVPPPETHRLLEAVRGGAGLLVVLNGGEPLADSLHLKPAGGWPMDRTRDTAGCPRADVGSPASMWPFSLPSLYGLEAVRAWPADTTVFVSVRPIDTLSASEQRARRRVRRQALPQALRRAQPRADSANDEDTTATPVGTPVAAPIAAPLVAPAVATGTDSLAPAVIGFPLGAGRVVVMSDADLVRNDVIRVCKFGIGVASVRALDWVSRSGRPALEFDEFHQTVPESRNIVWRYLTTTDSGHVVLQAIGAALLLMIAVGVRAVPPLAPRRIERRSSLEYVEALARAYAQARASRVAVRRLLRGLRRRHARSLTRDVPDDRFLDSLSERHPAIAPDTRLLRDAAGRTLTPAELLAVGQAVAHIDRTLHP